MPVSSFAATTLLLYVPPCRFRTTLQAEPSWLTKFDGDLHDCILGGCQLYFAWLVIMRMIKHDIHVT